MTSSFIHLSIPKFTFLWMSIVKCDKLMFSKINFIILNFQRCWNVKSDQKFNLNVIFEYDVADFPFEKRLVGSVDNGNDYIF